MSGAPYQGGGGGGSGSGGGGYGGGGGAGGQRTQRGKMSNEEKEQQLRDDINYQMKRNHLLTVLGRKNTGQLQHAIEQFEGVGASEENEGDLLRKSNFELEYLRLRDELWTAMGIQPPSGDQTGRDFNEMQAEGSGDLQPSLPAIIEVFKKLEEPHNKQFKDPLTPELMQARLLKMELSRNQKIPNKLDFDDKTMRTVRQYVVPPPIVHDVIRAFFLILGEYEGFTEDWNYCRRMLKPFGRSEGFQSSGASALQKGGLRARLEEFDEATDVKPEIAWIAQQILAPYTLSQICKVSEGVGSFFLWTSDIINKCNPQEIQLPPGAESGSRRRKLILQRERMLLGVPDSVAVTLEGKRA